MKPTNTTLAALVLVGVAGFTAGRISSLASADLSTPGGMSPASESALRMGEVSAYRQDTASIRKLRRAEQNEKQPLTPKQRLADLRAVVLDESPLNRSRALLAFIDQLGPDDFEETVAGFKALGINETRLGEYSMLLAAWAQVDPLAALVYAKANTGEPFATNTILSTWASSDPEAAIRWAASNHEGEGENPYMAGIIRSLAASDPTRATQLLSSLPEAEKRSSKALDTMLFHLLTAGSEATRTWIDSITDQALRNGAMLGAAARLAAIDPAGTASWLVANPGEATQSELDNLYERWSTDDEQGAIHSLAALPPGEHRGNALEGLISSVARRDPATAVSILDRFPNDVTDSVLFEFFMTASFKDPSFALRQLSRIPDEGTRDFMYRMSMTSWLESDNAAATAWNQNNPLLPAVQKHTESRLDEQRE